MVKVDTKVGYGTVQYERGMEIVEVSGYLAQDGPWLIVYGNLDLPAQWQRHTAIPMRRVVEVDAQLIAEPS